MSSPFLLAFCDAVVSRLIEFELLELQEGSRSRVIAAVALRLTGAKQGASLVSTLTAALLSCPEVEELWADDDAVRDLITDLPSDTLPAREKAGVGSSKP